MNTLYKIIFSLITLFFANSVFAIDSSLVFSQDSVSVGQEFFVDFNIVIQDEIINGIEGSVIYDEFKIEFVRAENSRSFVTHWINQPKVSNDSQIIFSGILPNGFGGFLNKTDENNVGNITRLVFRPINPGIVTIGLRDIMVTKNNGEGTIVKLKDQAKSMQINNDINKSSYNVIDFNKPELYAEITRDANLHNNDLTLVFNAIDKDSGIEGVYVKTKKDWVRIENPYNISSANLRGVLTVKAVDYTGNHITKRFLLPGYGINYKNILIAISIGAIFLFVFIYKKYVKNR